MHTIFFKNHDFWGVHPLEFQTGGGGHVPNIPPGGDTHVIQCNIIYMVFSRIWCSSYIDNLWNEGD